MDNDTNDNIDFSVSVDWGKYEYFLDKNGVSYCNRYGKKWRDTTGDKLIYCLALELKEAREKLEKIKKQVEKL